MIANPYYDNAKAMINIGEPEGECKWCGTTLFKAKKVRKIFYCRSCRHRYYRELDPEKYNERYRKWAAKQRLLPKEERYNWAKKFPEKNAAKNKRLNHSLCGQFYKGKVAARKRNLAWELSKEQYALIRKGSCHYCSGPLNPTGSGLDRKDPKRGYVLDNVVPCCHPCNRVKCEMLNYQEMVVAMKAVVRLRKRQNKAL